MGVKVRKNGGKWYLFINHKGKRKAKCIGGDKRLAESIARKMQAKLELDGLPLLDDPGITLAKYGERWLEDYATVNCKPNTCENYRRRLLNHVYPLLGRGGEK